MRLNKLKESGEFQSSFHIKIARLQKKDSLQQLKLCLKKAKKKLNEKLKRIKTQMDEIANDCSQAKNQIGPIESQHPSMDKFINQNVHKHKRFLFGIEQKKISPSKIYPRVYDSNAVSNREVKSEFKGRIQHCRSHTQQLERDVKRKIRHQRSSKKQKLDKQTKDENIMRGNSKKYIVKQGADFYDKQIVQEQQVEIEKQQNPIVSKSEAMSDMVSVMKNQFVGKIKRNRYLHRTDSDVLKFKKQTKLNLMRQWSKDTKIGSIVKNRTPESKQDEENGRQIKIDQNQHLQIERSLWKIQRKVDQFQNADLFVDHVVVIDQYERTSDQDKLNKTEQTNTQKRCCNNKLKDSQQGNQPQSTTIFNDSKMWDIARKQKLQKLQRTQVAEEMQVSGPEQLHYLMVKNIQQTNNIAKAKY